MQNPCSEDELSHFSGTLIVFERCLAFTRKVLQEDPGRLLQTRYSSLAGELNVIAALRYVLSFQMQVVQSSLAESSSASLSLFKSRHVFDADDFAVEYHVLDSTGRNTDSSLSGEAPKKRDYSLTSSTSGYLYTMGALAAGQIETARAIAALIWDPPNAKYVRRSSEWHTPNHQKLAFALRAFFLDELDECDEHLKCIRPPYREGRLAFERDLLTSIRVMNKEYFLRSLTGLISWNSAQLKRKANRRNPKMFLNLPAIGYCKMASEIGLINIDDIPSNEFVLPKELLLLPAVD